MEWIQRGYMQLVHSILVLLIIIIKDSGSEQAASTCLGPDIQSLDFNCPAGHMLQIVRVFHGYTDSANICSYSSGDCIFLGQRESYDCVGTPGCSIDLSQVPSGINLPKCQKLSNYIQVDYKCIAANKVTSICETELLTAQTGYISSQNYPNSYNASSRCELTVRVDIDQKLKFLAIDVNLQDVEDCLTSHDSYRSNTWCNRISNEHLLTSGGNEVRLTFETNEHNQGKGFWIYYEASPPRRLNNGPSPTVSSTRTTFVPTVVESKEKTTTVNVLKKPGNITSDGTDDQQNGVKEAFPLAAVVGGVLGSLMLILIILSTVLIVSKYQEARKHSHSESLTIIYT